MIYCPTELETIMQEEAEELIKKEYRSREGKKEMRRIRKKFDYQRCQHSSVTLLGITNLDQKIKMKDMERTTEFLSNMGLRFVEMIGQVVVT